MPDYPRPTKLGTPPATVGGKPTAQYGDPLKYVGRFVLSDQTTAVQNLGMRTVRARAIKQTPNGRLYVGLGEGVGAYSFDKFLSLLTSTPVGPAAIVNAPVSGRAPTPLEQIAKPESFWYGESPRSGWTISTLDIQATLGRPGFDVDDRGHVYIGTRAFGWGIGKDTGSGHFEFVHQDQTTPIIGEQVIALRVGSAYYVVLSDGRATAVFDVTDPSKPQQVGAVRVGKPVAMLASAKHDRRRELAWVSADSMRHRGLYTPFIDGGSAVDGATVGKWVDVAYDESGALWSIDKTVARVQRHDLSGAVDTFNIDGPFFPERIAAGAGLIAIAGRAPSGTTAPPPMDIRLFDVSGAAPVEIPTNGFFRDFYFAPPPQNARPGKYIGFEDFKIIAHGGKRYLILSVMGIGDVYEIGGAVPAVTPPVNPQPQAMKTCPTCGGSGKVSA